MIRRDEGCGVCVGCIGMGPCDDGAECDYGCGVRVLMPGDVCDRCEDEVTGRCDDADERYELEWADDG